MFVFYLVVFVVSFFVLLWLADAFLTLKSTNKLGSDIEINPVLKTVLSFRGRFFFIFKAVELIAFGTLIFFLSESYSVYLLYLLYLLILAYSILVAQGLNVYSKIFKSNKPTVVMFILTVFFVLFFVNLSYSIFFNSVLISEETNKCNNEYAELYGECKGTQPTENFYVDPFDLNIVIPGGD